MRRRHRRSDCPIHFGLEMFGDSWTLLIVRDLMFKGRNTYTEFLDADEGIASNILADRLVRLEEDGIINKERSLERAGASRYRLTSKGIDLLPILLEIIQWSARYDPKTAAIPQFVKRLRVDKAALAAELRSELEARFERKHARKPGRAAGQRRDRATVKRKNRETEVSS